MGVLLSPSEMTEHKSVRISTSSSPSSLSSSVAVHVAPETVAAALLDLVIVIGLIFLLQRR